MASNRKTGTTFESELCEILSQNGFWAHNLAQNSAGQPADVIAVRNKTAYLIDCKVCSRNKYSLSRMEDNQHFSMEFWRMCGNDEGWFALKLKDKTVVLIPHCTMEALSYEKSELNLKDIMDYGITLERWLSKC